MTPEITTVQAWQDAANNQDSECLIALSDPTIVIIGPRGQGSGYQLLRDWLARAGLTLTTQRIFQHGDTVVLAQHARWQSAATSGEASEADLASRFRVRGQRVVEFERYDDLASALTAASLSEADEYASTPSQHTK
jgi:ketosteroid isomerase-like protein